MDPNLITAEWEAWQKTEEGKACLVDGATGDYLKNRLWYAFMAGVTVGVEVGLKAPE